MMIRDWFNLNKSGLKSVLNWLILVDWMLACVVFVVLYVENASISTWAILVLGIILLGYMTKRHNSLKRKGL
jgi:Flp pilus assembly protein TadB